MPIPATILERVETFARNLESYLSPDYKETQLRREFLDPLFEALGWDVPNRAGYAEAYKDVVHEDSLRISGVGVAAPDYSFRIGGTRKFFVEAKKPAIRIKDDPEPALQLRRYSWSEKLPLGIVTDFHEFAIYETRTRRPAATDKASVGRIFYCTFDQYADKWDEIAAIFSREAVLRGSFDRFAASSRGKRGTAEFDAEFLRDMERWREALARNIALRNTLAQRDLNFAVQRILDRLIFLRIAEDRGIEKYGQLLALTNGARTYGRFCDICRRADLRYNSGLFHFSEERDRAESPDRLTLELEVDDATLAGIIEDLYWPKSPYAFAVVPADILGHVYEQFLGKIIHLTEGGHRVRIEEKPEVRKAGGVYYTPTYIVDYIVKQTVGPLLEGRTPKQVEKLRVLDPACGSGSFLLGAFDHLLDWHLRYYLEHDPESWAKKKNPPIYETAPNALGPGRGSRNWLLTTAERKRILTNNLHGVDIDAQAVEVTKLSLLLKVLEGEARELQGKQMDFHRVLPDLGRNIKCGNSLIGSDFYAQPDLPDFDDEARLKVNAFDWEHEFPEIMRAGGFDAVIGNPPYVRQESLKEQKAYFETHYDSYNGTADLFAYFMERGLRLLRPGGRYSIIVSSSLLRAAYAEQLRTFALSCAAIERIVDFGGLAVFSDAKDTYVCVPVLEKGAARRRVNISRVRSLDFESLDDVVAQHSFTVAPERMAPTAWSLKSDAEASLFEKISRFGTPLGNVVEGRIFFGLKTGLNEAFEITTAERSALLARAKQSEGLIKRFLGGQNVRRYSIRDEGRHLIVIPSGWTRAQMRDPAASEMDAWSWMKSAHPTIAAHLAVFESPARKRQDKGEFWWELRSCDYYQALDSPKIIFPDIAKSPRFYPDSAGIYLSNTAYFLGSPDLCLCALLNSRLCWFAISNIAIPFGMRAGEYRYRLFYQYMEKVPIRVIDETNAVDRRRRDTLVTHVERMLRLHTDLAAAKTPDAQTQLQREIAATDRAIDTLVYALYELTPEEIRLVEEATAPQPPTDAASGEDDSPAPASGDQAAADAAHTYFVKEPAAD